EHRQPAVEEHRERDRGVEVPTRYLAECVEGGEQAEPERERNGDEDSGPEAGFQERDNRRAPDEDEDERAEQLGEILLSLRFHESPRDRRITPARNPAVVRSLKSASDGASGGAVAPRLA